LQGRAALKVQAASGPAWLTRGSSGLVTTCYEKRRVSRMNGSFKLGIVLVASMSIILVMLPTLQKPVQSQGGAPEAPAGFDNLTNGHITQADFDDFRATFEEEEEIAEGLGPTFNNTGCANCHSVPVTGGSSRVFETRAGHLEGGRFVDHPGGSLVQDS